MHAVEAAGKEGKEVGVEGHPDKDRRKGQAEPAELQAAEGGAPLRRRRRQLGLVLRRGWGRRFAEGFTFREDPLGAEVTPLGAATRAPQLQPPPPPFF